VRAFRIHSPGIPPTLEEVPKPVPGPGQVLVKIGGAGLCHSDLHLMDRPEELLEMELPFTLGHENAGWVDTLGPGADGLEVGEPVAVYGPWGCGRCRACRGSAENYCEHQAQLGTFGGGLGSDGGIAEYMLVPHARWLIPLGDLDPRDAAPLTDAALTPYHAIKASLDLLVPGSTAVVIGVGGLGHMAVQILQALTSARIVAVDAAAEKLRLASEVGADATILAGDGAAERIRERISRNAVEVVIDMVGSDDSIALGAEVVAPTGHLTVVGLGGGAFRFEPFAFPVEARLASPYWGTAIDLMDVIALAAAGKIRAHVTRFPLDQVAEAYAALRSGSLPGRAVICPAG